jgi:hypothetical protein
VIHRAGKYTALLALALIVDKLGDVWASALAYFDAHEIAGAGSRRRLRPASTRQRLDAWAARRMTRSIYRFEAGRQAIQAWCELRLEAAGATGDDLSTSLGRTRVATIGVGPDIVLLPGTNFSTATGLRLLALVGCEHRAIGVDLPGQPGLSAEDVPAIAMPREFGSARSSTGSASSVQSSWAIRSAASSRCSLPVATHRSKASCLSVPPA